MVQIHPALLRLQDSYLFQKIARRVEVFKSKYSHIEVLNLGIGDTSGPLHPNISDAMHHYADALTTSEGYQGYGPSEGIAPLREAIAKNNYSKLLSPDEIFVSDGAKCDLSRLLYFFGPNVKIGLQSPSYPAFIDDAVLSMASGPFSEEKGTYQNIRYFPCTKENSFSPDFSEGFDAIDLLYICNPNNPTGSCLNRGELEGIVENAIKHNVIILYDVAYRDFIVDSDLPKSIYEIEGAHTCAIELGSFSKSFGFTGLRLGWVCLPKNLKYESGESMHKFWSRFINTSFNGPSRMVQMAGLAAFDQEVLKDSAKKCLDVSSSAKRLKETLRSLGCECFGGVNAPYIWCKVPQYESSWDAFDFFLNNLHIVTVPGSGFGSEGEGYIRFSAFPKSSIIDEAIQRLEEKSAYLSIEKTSKV